jgi:predicted RNA-binding protein with PUA domain
MEDIVQYDIMSTPALVVDEEVVLSGRIPEENELEEILTNK